MAGVGRRMPTGFVDAMIERRAQLAAELDDWQVDVEVLPARLITDVIGPLGSMPMGPHAAQAECPMAAELLHRSPM